MRIETNEKLIQRNKQIATYLFLFSMTILIGGFFIANGQAFGIEALENFSDSLYLLVMPIVLIVGMTSTLFSVRMTNLWVRMPRPETIIEAGLKGIGKKGVLYNYYHFPARHVLIVPQGVFAIITRYQDGSYTVEGDRWKTHRSPLSRLFSIFRLDGIGNPTQDAVQAAEHIQRIMQSLGINAPVQPLIIFVDPRAKLEIKSSQVPVLFADSKLFPNIKDYLKDIPKDSRATLLPEEIDRFDEITKSGKISVRQMKQKSA